MRDGPAEGQPSSATTPPSPGTTSKPTLGGTLVLTIAMTFAGYLGGRVQAWSAVRETKAQLQVAVEEHEHAFENAEKAHRADLVRIQDELERTRKDREQLAKLTQMYEGLRRGYRSLAALDARNFGNAQAHLRAAEDVLAPVIAEVPELREAVTRISATNIVVAGELPAQREQLAALILGLDALVTRQDALHEAQPRKPIVRPYQAETRTPDERGGSPKASAN